MESTKCQTMPTVYLYEATVTGTANFSSRKKESIFLCSFHFRSRKPADDLQANMPDPIQKRSVYGRLWSRIVYAGSASDSVPFFQRRPGSYCAKPSRIRSEWPGEVLAKRIWSRSKSVCKNHRAWFWQNAKPARYQFPTLAASSPL